ncbi:MULTISPECIES: DUF2280 domain-containing protein [unclassified Arsenophonus]|uniref:DUF2280 domain-containing protein n=1 Tax=unclassified Arsenophonus TaxID=2627083 RepID=UPI0028629AB3|nr:DUF2280 domain-containing protein [Arsenophonus sp.]MDR5615116.1 DUF2280 domain-containing protein [Arsenophonus sp.]
MAALSPEVKAFIVQSLACFDSPTQVLKQVKLEFGLTLTVQQVSSYDPTKAIGKSLGQKWVDLFHFTRERFKKEISDIPIANKAYRLRVLNRMAIRTESMDNFLLTAQMIEQAAKECGDAYTNKQKIEHSGTSHNQVELITHEMTPEQAAEAYKKLMG